MVGKVEQGARECTFLEVLAWCKACGIAPSEFLGVVERRLAELPKTINTTTGTV
jgi:hypothetical protein